MIFSSKCTLIRCISILGLVNLSAMIASIDCALSITSNQEVDSIYFHMRPRLGHFHKVEGYLKIYEDYFSNVVQKLDKAVQNLDINDWRNARPTGEMCINFLQGFQVKNYKLNKPYDLIPLDACLGWLFDTSSEKKFDLDRFNAATKEELKLINKDKKLKEIFESTNFKQDAIPKELKEKILEYFLKLLKVYNDNPRNGCHSLWLESYNDFIEEVYLNECEEGEEECVHFGFEGGDKDSYLNLIVESIKQASKNCYNVMQKQMAGLMYAAYDQEAGLYSKLKATTSRVAKQSDSLRWSREMIRILQLVTGTDPEKPVKLADVSQDLLALKANDESEVERFTDAIGKYAMSKVDMKDSTNDPEGRARFGKAMTRLCKPYIDKKNFLALTGGSTLWEEEEDVNKKSFEFYHLIYSLLRLTNHESIYGISKDKFEEDVLKNGWESLYLATLACQIISTTWGQLDYETNRGEYKVYLRPNARVLIEDWPVQVIDNKLQAERVPEQAEAEPEVAAEVSQPQVVQQQKPAKQQRASRPIQAAPSMFNPVMKQKTKKLDSPQEPQQKVKQESTVTRVGLRFKNPLRAQKRPVVEETDKSPAVQAPVPDMNHQASAITTTPTTTTTTKPPNELSADTLEMFRKLHGRYPKNSPGERFPEPNRKLEGIFPKELDYAASSPELSKSLKIVQKKTPEVTIPVVSGQGKPNRGNKWADLDAISL